MAINPIEVYGLWFDTELPRLTSVVIERDEYGPPHHVIVTVKGQDKKGVIEAMRSLALALENAAVEASNK